MMWLNSRVNLNSNLIRLKKFWRSIYSTADKYFEEFILKNTVISGNHLTPEIRLLLITPDCELWRSNCSEWKFPNDPFWGIYWPGGQALGRFILDNKAAVKNKNVIDIGSGSGACAIAAAKSGASQVLANDIDDLSIVAINLNAKLNNVKIHCCQSNLIAKAIDETVIINFSTKPIKWDVVLIGDMFYDSEFSARLFQWATNLVKNGKRVLVGDPGRHALNDLHNLKAFGKIVKIAEYKFENIEHNGYPTAAVYEVEAAWG